MKKILLLITLFATSSLLADTALGVSIGNGNIKVQAVQKKHAKPIKRVKKGKRFKKDHHRYNKRYQKFDYDTRGYYDDDGFYFGYFDRSGYFFNNIFFEYDSRYTYRDRCYNRGSFRPTYSHYRHYRHHRNNSWNQRHSYREPDVIVHGHYYETRYYPEDRGYRDNGRIINNRNNRYDGNQRDYNRGRDEYRRGNNSRNYDYSSRNRNNNSRYDRGDSRYNDRRGSYNRNDRRDTYERRQYKDSGTIKNRRFSNESSKYREERKPSKSNGHLQITK